MLYFAGSFSPVKHHKMFEDSRQTFSQFRLATMHMLNNFYYPASPNWQFSKIHQLLVVLNPSDSVVHIKTLLLRKLSLLLGYLLQLTLFISYLHNDII